MITLADVLQGSAWQFLDTAYSWEILQSEVQHDIDLTLQCASCSNVKELFSQPDSRGRQNDLDATGTLYVSNNMRLHLAHLLY